MNKSILLTEILKQLDAIKLSAEKAANQAHETATHSETVARSKYETFGLEASYLAHGQAQRVAQCSMDLKAFTELNLCAFNDETPIGLGALVVIMDEKDDEQSLFIGPGAGGVKFSMKVDNQALAEDVEVMVITPSSPLGNALMGRMLDDTVVINIGDNRKEYEIIAVY
ncbi:conserved hypothetical protein [Shewanella sediminis HAW-EB3]|uniref:Transcription elongation factor GreA/GreB C-terminal domain-containing protein n=1 Tax=Shewanella sediminis (strain HAW-EB3) TaxID=425104 RepID=A8FVY8_SHESH|nr:GreA/GreB family elongation factor [Shewanella sediminis]ABV37011.1 conserved hypothetical protein [Shewanella sediminis HAW-EB3]